MVKNNPNNNSLHDASLILEEDDKKAIRETIDGTSVDIQEMKISNPGNDLEGLYIQIASTDRNDLFKDNTIESVKRAANRVGYNGTRMDHSGVPSVKQPSRFVDYNQKYYTLAIWFKHRR